MHGTRVGQRMDGVADPIIPVLGQLIASNPGTISLGQGMVAFGPPPSAVEAVMGQLDTAAMHRYQAGDGLPPLIDRVSAKLAAENRIDLHGRRIIVTAGANMAFLHLMLALLDPGDEVIFPVPYYFNYPMAVALADGRPVGVPTDERYQLRIEAIARAITPRTKAVVTISPNNPTGAVYPEDDLTALNELCAARGIHHVSDEVYEYFTFGPTHHFSPASLPDSAAHTITINSFSKAFGMAGWRVGYMAVPERLGPALVKVQDTNLVCPPVFSQSLAAAVLDAPREACRAQIARLATRRQLAVDRLSALPGVCTLPPTEGALYLFVKVHTTLEPMTVTERLIRDHGVAVVPGDAFGHTEGCTLRIAYGAVTDEQASAGLDRLVDGLVALTR